MYHLGKLTNGGIDQLNDDDKEYLIESKRTYFRVVLHNENHLCACNSLNTFLFLDSVSLVNVHFSTLNQRIITATRVSITTPPSWQELIIKYF